MHYSWFHRKMQFLNSFYHAITSDLLTLPCPWCDQGNVQQKKCSSHLEWDNLGHSRHPRRVQGIRPVCFVCSVVCSCWCTLLCSRYQRPQTALKRAKKASWTKCWKKCLSSWLKSTVTLSNWRIYTYTRQLRNRKGLDCHQFNWIIAGYAMCWACTGKISRGILMP